MSDDKPPEGKDTTRIPSAEIQTGLLNKVLGMLTDMKSSVDGLRSDMDSMKGTSQRITDEVGLVKQTVGAILTWKDTVDDRLRSNSLRAQSMSQSDLDSAAQLAQERSAREELAKKVDTLTAVNQQQLSLLQDIRDGASKLLQRPEVKWLAAALWMAFTGWLATKGIK